MLLLSRTLLISFFFLILVFIIFHQSLMLQRLLLASRPPSVPPSLPPVLCRTRRNSWKSSCSHLPASSSVPVSFPGCHVILMTATSATPAPVQTGLFSIDSSPWKIHISAWLWFIFLCLLLSFLQLCSPYCICLFPPSTHCCSFCITAGIIYFPSSLLLAAITTKLSSELRWEAPPTGGTMKSVSRDEPLSVREEKKVVRR